MLLEIAKFNLLLFIFCSGITITYGEVGKGILGRLALPDIFGASFIILYLLDFLIKKRASIHISNLIKYLYIFLFSLLFGILMASKSFLASIIEILILTFELLILTFAFDVLKNDEKFLRKIFMSISLALIFVSLYGIYDIMAQVFGLPVLIKKEIFAGCASSTFRNCGQAGAFSLIFTFILLALYNSKIVEEFSKLHKTLILTAIVSGMILLFLTVKVASYVGFFLGVFLFSLLNVKQLNVKYFLHAFVFVFIFYIFYNIFSQTKAFETWYGWFLYKIEKRIAELEDENDNSFLYHNWSLAIEAFLDNPFLGSGLGGFANVYDKFEIHSTPLKFLGETGALGLSFYMGFIYLLIYKRFLAAKKFVYINRYADFIYKLYPLFLGLMVNWIYTYHFRKREFWVLLIILELCSYYMRREIKWELKKNS